MRGRVQSHEPPDRTHWQSWHLAYDEPDSSLSRRLAVVQSELFAALDDAGVGPIRVLSLCAGDGRDLLGVLATHPRSDDVVATLVELDHGLAARARRNSMTLGRATIAVVEADAGDTSAYLEPEASFEVVLCCGVFGNIMDDEIHTTIRGLAGVVVEGGSVLWTRHRREPNLVPAIRRWFDEEGFDEVAFVGVQGSLAAVGRTRHGTAIEAAPAPTRWFRFLGDGSGASL